MQDVIPVLLDTDIGSDIDDALCLAYLLAEPRCNLLGITTASGEAGKRAMLADALCRAAGRHDVPIAAGAEQPLMVPQRQKTAPQAEALTRWKHHEFYKPNAAVELLRSTIHKHAGEITLLTIGPLTNIGILFALDREIPRLLKGMVVMAGHFFEDDHLEWNASGDPHATAIVFSSDAPEIRVLGLDVTLKCHVKAKECREKFVAGPMKLVAEMAEVWWRNHDDVIFHDPLAGACIFEPDLCRYRRGRIEVEVSDDPLLGQTVLKEDKNGPHYVAHEVHPARFFKRHFSTIERYK